MAYCEKRAHYWPSLPQAQPLLKVASAECVINELEKVLKKKEVEEEQILAQLQIIAEQKDAIRRTIEVYLSQ